MEPVICGSESVCIEISFVSSDYGEANKSTRKNRGDPQNGEKPCAADHPPPIASRRRFRHVRGMLKWEPRSSASLV